MYDNNYKKKKNNKNNNINKNNKFHINDKYNTLNRNNSIIFLNNLNFFNNNFIFNQRYSSVDNKNRIKEEENIYNTSIDNTKSYLENKYDQYTDKILFHKLPEDIQILLYFINVNKNIKKNNFTFKKSSIINKDDQRKSMSPSSNLNLQIKNNNKQLIQNRSEIYSNKIKLKNRFIKLNEEEKWNKQLMINRKSVATIIKRRNKRDNTKRYMELLNMSLETYKKIENFILMQIKIRDINISIKKDIADIEKYLESKKKTKSVDNIYKFIFGNKVK